MTERARVAIVGAGFSGLGMAIRLLQEGRPDFVVLERGDDIGGVWRDNSYPGCACDVQSSLYSYSFAPNPTWSRRYSPQAEILAYLKGCAARYGVGPKVRLGTELQSARWDAEARRWRLETSRGPLEAETLVSANGALSEPAIPPLPGIERFLGRTFHSARWDHGYDLASRRVAVVGTGASAIQFVPAIQPRVAALHVYQRTPPWIMPRLDRPTSALARRLYAAVPALQSLVRGGLYLSREAILAVFRSALLTRVAERLALRHLARSVPDAALRARLTPRYRFGCKRILISDDYLPSLGRPNVEVVTDEIREVRARSIVASDGREREVDAIIYGTGFRVTDPPIAALVRGRDGRTLAEAWAGSGRAHLGTTVAGYPNFFVLTGPNTGLGHSSMILMIEAQIEHVLGALRHLDGSGARAVEPRPEAQASFVADCEARMRGSVWTAGGCTSWYLDRTGRNSTLWPGYVHQFTRRVAPFDAREYVVEA